ncbi:MAG: hypothetical protein F6J93_03685 [Oscillatoria sp. SIO1A7]|nr:hypothetical protein [Oscillatoria sp. SIO1A7]
MRNYKSDRNLTSQEILQETANADFPIVYEIKTSQNATEILSEELDGKQAISIQTAPALFFIICNLLGESMLKKESVTEEEAATNISIVDWIVKSSLEIDRQCPKTAAYLRFYARELLCGINAARTAPGFNDRDEL